MIQLELFLFFNVLLVIELPVRTLVQKLHARARISMFVAHEFSKSHEIA